MSETSKFSGRGVSGEVRHFETLPGSEKETGSKISERIAFEGVFGSIESDDFFKNIDLMLNQIDFPRESFIEEVGGDEGKKESIRVVVKDYMYAVDLDGKKNRCKELQRILG